jgi:hypothetical protein
MAVLEKPARNQTAVADSDDHCSRSAISDYPPMANTLYDILAERFGLLPEVFEPNLLYQANPKRVYMVNRDHRPPARPAPDAVGLYFLKTRIRYPKLSTAAAIHVGAGATRNYLEVDRPQVEAYVNRQVFEVSTEQARHCTGPGYVLLKHQGFSLGVAFFEPGGTGGGGEVGSLFPKGWSPAKGESA